MLKIVIEIEIPEYDNHLSDVVHELEAATAEIRELKNRGIEAGDYHAWHAQLEPSRMGMMTITHGMY